LRVLVTGAGGYIGSQTCKELKRLGYEVVANDRQLVKHEYQDAIEMGSYANIRNTVLETVDAIIHIGATSLVGPSVENPAMYYQNNVGGTMDLLDRCRETGVKKFIFASSAACYGEPENGVCTIADGNTPSNPYGWTKRMTEVMLSDYAKAYGIDSVSLRFFNVAGADSDGEMGQEKQATHIIARAMESAMANDTFTLFGTDYPTKDGTCIRDYIHVEDIARAIGCSIDFLNSNAGAHVFNLGSGTGYSNLEIIEAINANIPLTVNLVHGPKRPGDPPCLIADTTETKILGWQPIHKLDKIVQTAYNWYNIKSEKNIDEQISTN